MAVTVTIGDELGVGELADSGNERLVLLALADASSRDDRLRFPAEAGPCS